MSFRSKLDRATYGIKVPSIRSLVLELVSERFRKARAHTHTHPTALGNYLISQNSIEIWRGAPKRMLSTENNENIQWIPNISLKLCVHLLTPTRRPSTSFDSRDCSLHILSGLTFVSNAHALPFSTFN